MHTLTDATLKANANLSLVKGGMDTSYSKVTEGEKLRLKVATILAMLEIGEQKGVGRHPGLLMIDSPGAQEVFQDDLDALVSALQAVAKDIPHCQIFVSGRSSGGVLVKKDALQADFFRLLTTNAAGSDLEPTNIGGGRADVRLKSSSERLVIEVKRELKNSSFDALSASYHGQTVDYQNVSVRLGSLLVLDLLNDSKMGTPHIQSLVQTRLVQRVGEDQPRLIVIVKVPGNRKRPRDLTKAARTDKSQRRAKKANA